MEFLQHFCFIVGLFYCFFGQGYSEISNDIESVETVGVDVNTSGIIAQTSERFLSLGFSPYYLKDNFSMFDITCLRVKTLLSGLAPTVLRLGGTKAELLTFKSQGYQQLLKKQPIHCTNVDFLLEGKSLPDPYVLTGEVWDIVNKLALNSGARVAFGLSAIKRQADGEWDPSNALELFNYTLGKPYATNIDWELGNEPNAYKLVFGLDLSAKQHGRDFVALHHILRDMSPYKQQFAESLIIGPDMTQPNKKHKLEYAQSFVSEAGKSIDRFSWHHYYVSSKDPNTTIDTLMDPAVLDSLQTEISAIRGVLAGAGYSHTPMWTGECSSASGGGVKDASDRYVAGFMWLDRLGVSAQAGIEVVVRWSLMSGNYALLNKNSYPLPDYWLSWIYKALVGDRVFNVTTSDTQRKLRMYAHCTKASSMYSRGSLTLYGMNLHTHKVKVELPPSLDTQKKHVYLLTAHGKEGLRSSHVNLNSEKLEMVSDTELPQLKPRGLDPGARVEFPGQSFGFIVIPGANIQACM